MLTTDQKGNIAELAVTLAATHLGIVVFRPTGEGSRYDVIFDLGTRLLRVQCKWAPLHNDVIVVPCRSCRRAREGMRSRSYTAEEIDAIAAYCPDTEACYLIPIERVARTRSIQLRVAEPRNGQRAGIVWAHDFDFAKLDWSAPGAVAQLGERRRGTAEAGGSSPPSSTSGLTEKSDVEVVGSHVFRNHFGYYLEGAAAGKTLLITRHGQPHARLSPVPPALASQDAL